MGERERRRAGRAQEAAARGRRCRRGRAAFGRERHAGAGPDAGTQSPDGADAGAQRSGRCRMRARGLRPAFAGEKNMEHKIF